ncbi:hypothetical protein RQP46_010028 [Phenoliferia psychrophenolica]
MAAFTSQAPITILAALLTLAFVGRNLAHLVARFRRNVAILQDYPGIRVVFHPNSFFGMLPRFPGINIGSQYIFRHGTALFSDRNNSDIISLVSLFPPARAIVLADPIAVKHVLQDRQRYIKPSHLYRALGNYGMNIAIAEGNVWKRHKKIVAGSFTEKSNELAWKDAVRVTEELLSEWERNPRGHDGKRMIVVESFLDVALKAGLYIIMATSFSQRPPWRDDEQPALPAGHTLPFKDAMLGVASGAIINTVTPSWAYKLPIRKLQHVDVSYREFEVYKDLLGALIYASTDMDDEDGEDKESGTEKKRATLSDDELMGNIFFFLLAGHETSANAIAFVFVLLALYPEEQEKLFQHINEVLPPDAEPVYADFAKLTRVQAVFNESARLYPALVAIPKYAMQDTVVPTTPIDDSTPATNIFIPKWTDIYLDAVALGRSQKYWGEDAATFKPDRFFDAPDGSYRWPRDAFLGFSGGHRACLGQKVATVTSTAVIALLIRKFSVHLPEDLDGTGAKRTAAGETFQEKNSASLFDNPTIDPGYFTHPADIQILREAFKFARTVGQAAPLSSILTTELNPGSGVSTDAEWEAWIRSSASTEYHPAGTCSMLPLDLGGVVDTNMRVHGTNNLRVIDSSIVPVGLSAHMTVSLLLCSLLAARIAENANQILVASETDGSNSTSGANSGTGSASTASAASTSKSKSAGGRLGAPGVAAGLSVVALVAAAAW